MPIQFTDLKKRFRINRPSALRCPEPLIQYADATDSRADSEWGPVERFCDGVLSHSHSISRVEINAVQGTGHRIAENAHIRRPTLFTEPFGGDANTRPRVREIAPADSFACVSRDQDRMAPENFNAVAPALLTLISQYGRIIRPVDQDGMIFTSVWLGTARDGVVQKANSGIPVVGVVFAVAPFRLDADFGVVIKGVFDGPNIFGRKIDVNAATIV